MNFYSVVDQAIALLRQRGRVTYRALKRQFALDDEALADLTEELMYGQRLAADEDGRVLVWTGDMPMVTEPHASLSPSGHPSPTHEDPPAHTATPPVSPMADAERRQLTVMFCDVVDSTALSGQLDPEDLRDVVRAYHRVCSAVITRFDGYIAQLLGDGLLVYFGYPQAHDDDAQRAVRAGLGILAALDDLNQGLQRAPGIQLAVRLGIHTGLVVVGAMGGHGRQEQLALGATPNIAARIQGMATPNTVAISDTSYRLVQGYFDCEALGAQTLRGVTEPIDVYRVLTDRGAYNRLDIVSPRGLTPLVGREQEVGLLLERWAQVKAGHGHVVLLSGEGGIGKSRLVQVLKEHVANEPHVRWECRSAEYSQNTALFPLTDLFQRLLRFQAEESPDEKLGKLEHALSEYRLPLEESVALFAPLLSLSLPENRRPLLHLSPQQQRQKTLETIVAILQEHAERHPVLFIIEDLHWTDPTTLELLHLVIEQTPTSPLLTLLTCRPTFQPSWSYRSYLTEMTINRLSQPQIERMIERITDEKHLPLDVRQLIVQRTDGVPLFVEEITKAVLESGHLKNVDRHSHLTGALPSMAIPATLQDALMARLDRLVTAKAIAQYAAVIGRQFPYALLQAVSPLDEAMLQHELGRLVEAEIVYQRGVPPQTTYTFKHALIQDAAYESLLKSTRQQYHQRIAQVLEERFPETAETQPELLAHHYTAAGLGDQAIGYWRQAGEKAIQRSAYVEAISHLTTGLEVLKPLPETPERTQRELALYIALGGPLQVTKGWASPEVEYAYARARELCRQVGDTPLLFSVLGGLATFYQNRGDLQTARELQEQRLALAQHQQDAARLMGVHASLESILYNLGEFPLPRAHFEQSLTLDEPHQHRFGVSTADVIVNCLSIGANVLQLLGYPEQGLARLHVALKRACELAHPFTLVFAHFQAADFHRLRREGQAAQRHAEVVVALASEHGFAQRLAQGIMQRGWALAEQGRVAEGIAQMRQGLAALQSTGAKQGVPGRLGLLAEAHGKAGQVKEGLRVVAEALTMIDNNGERRRESELYCLKGELLLLQVTGQQGVSSPLLATAVGAEAERGGATLASPLQTEAEACFRQALNVACRQEAKSLELRAALSLSRLWQQQGKCTEAHELLAPIYGWFTEGFDTADLQQAKVLLEELDGCPSSLGGA